MNTDTLILISILAISAVAFLLFYLREKNDSFKTIYVFFTISFFIYSGVGIALKSVSNYYILHYSIFLIATLASIYITKRVVIKRNGVISENKSRKVTYLEGFAEDKKMLFFILTIIFLLTVYIGLVYPENHLDRIIKPPTSTLIGIFDKQAEQQNNVILKIAQTLNVFLTPFFFIHIHFLIRDKKKIRAVLLIAIWEYGKYLVNSYLSRNEIIKILVLIVLILTAYDFEKNEYRITGKHYLILLIGLLLLIPLMASYISLRLTGRMEIGSFQDSLSYIISTECGYPLFYEKINSIGIIIKPYTYFLWILFLPIPSVLWRGKPTIDINNIFTYSMYHITPSDAYYSVSLPSLLGESFTIFGTAFFWIEAFTIGVIIGAIFKWFSKYRYLKTYSLFYIVNLLTLARGGSQGYLSGLVNGAVGIVVFHFIALQLSRKNH